MLGIGWTEMLVIGVVALIVIGPKDLPVLMQRMGKVVGSIRRMGMEFQREINRSTGLDQVQDLRRTITEPLRKTSAEIAREFNSITPSGVQPSGVIKPADPKAESVVDEIRAAAGLPPTPAVVAPVAPVMTADAAPARKTRTRRAKPIESPGPVETVAPTRRARTKPASAPVETPAKTPTRSRARVRPAGDA